MRPALLSPYRHGTSPVHRAAAGAKLAVALALILLTVMLPRGAWVAYGAVGMAVVVIALASRVELRGLILRLALLEPFVLGVALLALLGPDGPHVFAAMLAKSTLCLAVMVLLTATTRFSELIGVLWRMHVPVLLVTTLALMHRYVFVLLEELERMRRARRSRTFRHGRAVTWRGSAQVAGQLFIRSSERAERVYLAMCARGWRQE
ncbi:MAG TPA: cobalt ECF transporter T component CbiQ [Steroidobacteraceae bacterium]|nr:cobalt ECF transporter T component CbiQ [Steroidobacteraceae bacterium]